MNDFIYKKEDNMGGIIRFKFLKVTDAESIDFPINHSITTPVTLVDEKQWFTGYGTLGTLIYSETEEDTPSGKLYKRAFNGFYPKDDVEVDALFNEMRHARFLIDYIDSNGFRKLIGSLQEPLRFTSSLNTKQQTGELAGHSFSFYGDGTHKAYAYNI